MPVYSFKDLKAEILKGQELCQQCMGRGIDVANPRSNYKSWKFIECPICKGQKHVSMSITINNP